MKISTASYIFFVGIGGIGMSALARYCSSLGKIVLGYDKTSSALTEALMQEGIEIIFEDNPKTFRSFAPQLTPQNTLVVYTPAVPTSSQLMSFLQNEDFKVVKRGNLLGEVTRKTHNLSIAGTHGKTTTSCLLSHILRSSNVPAVSILGGISTDLNSNYHNSLIPGRNVISVTEADEFDRSFLHLLPDSAAITSMDADHLDIYGDEKNIRQSFIEFAKCLKPNGSLYVHHSLQPYFEEQKIPNITYGIKYGQVSAQHVHIHNHEYIFDLYYGNDIIRNLILGIPGRHNVENAVVASAIALDHGVNEEQLRKALSSFQGVKRRFEYILKEPVYIDDYAHHPTELNAIIGSVKSMYSNKHITGIFQPHLYSRTEDFAAEFAKSLSSLDRLILLDIYPAREEPIPGVTSEIILNICDVEDKILLQKSELIDYLGKHPVDVLLTLGAGDIDRLVLPIKEFLQKGGSDA